MIDSKAPVPLKRYTPTEFEQAILARLPARVVDLVNQLSTAFPSPIITLEPDRWFERHIQRLRRHGLVEPRREGRISVWHRTGAEA